MLIMLDLIALVTKSLLLFASLGQLGKAWGMNLELNPGETGQWRKQGRYKLAKFSFVTIYTK